LRNIRRTFARSTLISSSTPTRFGRRRRRRRRGGQSLLTVREEPEHACTPKLSPLLTVTGAPAVATTKVTPPNYATPTPTPVEPQSYTTSTASSGGWNVVPSPLLGKNNNSLGAVAG
jgi:hypothetical protein